MKIHNIATNLQSNGITHFVTLAFQWVRSRGKPVPMETRLELNSLKELGFTYAICSCGDPGAHTSRTFNIPRDSYDDLLWALTAYICKANETKKNIHIILSGEIELHNNPSLESQTTLAGNTKPSLWTDSWLVPVVSAHSIFILGDCPKKPIPPTEEEALASRLQELTD